MSNEYLTLFKELAHAVELLAEQVMEYDHEHNDEGGEKTAQIMRDDFAALASKFDSENPAFERNDFIKLLTGVYIIVNNLQDKITNIRKTIDGYNTNVGAKLQRIMNETTSDEEAAQLANELFNIQQN